MKPLEKYAEIRKSSKLSQAKFAEKFGVKVYQIKELDLRRQKSIPDNLALALEKEYGIPFKWWKTGEGDMSSKPPQEDIDRAPAHIGNEFEKLLSSKEIEILMKILGENKQLLFLMLNKLENEPQRVKKFLLED